MTHFSALDVGSCARITGFGSCSTGYRRKLLMLGLTRGTTFTVTGKAPFGDPVQIRVRGTYLSVRQREADALELELVDA